MLFSRLSRWSILSVCVTLAACGGSSSTQPPPPAAVSVSVSPSNATVGAAGTQSLTATVTNATDGVPLTVEGGGSGESPC